MKTTNLLIAGFGGQGVLFAGKFLAYKGLLEGKQLSSEELADKLGQIGSTHGEVCLVIGSSHGLDPSVKNACDMRLSVSKLTFPHQLMRVILLEAVYRGFNILKGTHYHK